MQHFEPSSYLPTLEKVIEYFPLKVTPDTPLTEVLALMNGVSGRTGERCSINLPPGAIVMEEEAPVAIVERASCVLVTQESQLVGIFTERDLVRLVAENRDLTSVIIAEVMTREIVTLTLTDSEDIFSALQLIRQHRIRHLPIIDEKKQRLGIVTTTSLRLILQPSNLLRLRRVEEMMTTQVIHAPLNASLLSVAKLMSRHKVSCVVITQETGEEMPSSATNPVGIITERDIVQFQRLELNFTRNLAQTVMSGPLACVSPTDSLWEVQQEMQRLLVRRLVVTGSQGELLGLVTQTNLLKAIDPTEIYATVEIWQKVVETKTSQLVQLNQQLQQEIEVRKKIEALLQESEQRYRLAFEDSGIGMVMMAPDGRWLKVNRRLCAILGQSEAELLGNSSQDLIDDHGIIIARDGKEYATNEPGTPICARNGQIIGNVLVFRDVTQSQKLARQLSWQANHDSLTGLLNRRAFEQKLLEALVLARDQNQEHVLCYLDLDQFKIVNDTCGHLVGDELLRQVTALFQRRVRYTDILARLGGDEFGILLYQCSLEKASEIVETIRELIQDFRFPCGGKTFSIGASMGLVLIDAHSQDLNSLLGAADAACYAAKEKGRNSIHIYQPDDLKLVRQRGERHWIAEIDQALEENRLCLYSQKIVPVIRGSGKEHYEILLRLLSSTGEIVKPTVFIPAAERYGLMPIIDRWVINNFFDSYSRHYKANLINPESEREYLYTINLSGASVNDNQFLDFLQNQLARYLIAPQTICFEITETAAIANLSQAAQLINSVKELGCCFALDDFGTGMSSLAYLKNLPVDYLKIDGSFIRNLLGDRINCVMVESFNRISHAMGIQTIAEFVENETTLSKLREFEVDYAQGYGIARPSPLNFNHIDEVM